MKINKKVKKELDKLVHELQTKAKHTGRGKKQPRQATGKIEKIKLQKKKNYRNGKKNAYLEARNILNGLVENLEVVEDFEYE